MKKHKKHRQCPVPEMLTPERYDLAGKMEAVSSTDQTGLISFTPETGTEYENYNDIIQFEQYYGE